MPMRDPRSKGDPFDLPGGPDAVLLLHGLTGSPFEVRHVAERLNSLGMRCVGPLMPGHGGDPRALLNLTWRDWVEGAKRELVRVQGEGKVFVVGSSMGGMVTCVLAHDMPGYIDGVALLSPALQLGGTARLAGFLAHTPLSRVVPILPKLGGSDVTDPIMKQANPAMAGVPLAAVAQLTDLADQVDGMLPGIAAPTLVIAGKNDQTVKLSGARRIARRVGVHGAMLIVLPRSGHLVGIDVEKDYCADAVASFFERLRKK